MDVIILCAGYATRLYPLTENCPKPLLPVNGRPLVEYILDKITKHESVQNVYLITNDRFYKHFCDWKKKYFSPKNVEILNDHSTSDADKLGAIGDLGFTIKSRKMRGATLVVAGDNLFDFELAGFLHFAEEKKAPAVIGAFDVADKELAKKYGILALDKNWKITSFLEKPKDPPSTFASMAIYYFSSEGVSLIQEYLDKGLNPDQPGHYIRWLSENKQVYGYIFKGHWFDIGDLDSYRKADVFYKQKSLN